MSSRVDCLFERMEGSVSLKTVCSDDGKRTWMWMSYGLIITSHTPLAPLRILLQFIWMYYEGVRRVDWIKVSHNMRPLADRSAVSIRCSYVRMSYRVFDTCGVEFDIVTSSIMSRMLSRHRYILECTRNSPNAQTAMGLCGRISGRVARLLLRMHRAYVECSTS